MKTILLCLVTALIIPGCSGGGHDSGLKELRVLSDVPHPSRHVVEYEYLQLVAIPDDDTTGVLIGPLRVHTPNEIIRNTVVSVTIDHPWSGDLTLELRYDQDRDGIADMSTPIEIYLARIGRSDAEELWAYPFELGDTYYFRDEDWTALGEEASLRAFNGLAAGGSFFLEIIDRETDNTGVVHSWGIELETSPAENGDRPPAIPL